MSCNEDAAYQANCDQPLFSIDRGNDYVLSGEKMTLQKATFADTSFYYLVWQNPTNEQVFFVFDQSLDWFNDATYPAEYYVSGAVKFQCEEDPILLDIQTSVINLFSVERIAYCPVAISQSEPRSLINTTWRLLHFQNQEGRTFPPTCEENFLSLKLTTRSIDSTNNQMYEAEIYSGVEDCNYEYLFYGPGIAKIKRNNCDNAKLDQTIASKAYGSRFIQGLLDPDAIHLTHSGNTLVIRPENMIDVLVFKGL